ncbi:MAG TPA: putative aminohydrolase SsnA [Candidatus Merdenecus merdavium]|nr:putative aminohydrolase SsnA [Candidatus Merdenecus merdavium]
MLLIGNGRLVTRDSAHPYFENGAVLVDNGVVKEVGNYEDMKAKYASAEFVDAKGKVIMPGLINTHAHIYSSFARGMPSKGPAAQNVQDILTNLWWRLDKGLTQEDNKYSAYTTLIDSIKYGVTTVFDHHASPFSAEGSLFTIADVAKELGIRVNLAYETTDRDGEDVLKAGIKENVDFMKHYNTDDQDMVKGMFGMHASFTLSDRSMDMCKEAMEGVKGGYHIHVAECEEDPADSLKKYGKRVVERLDDFGIINEDSLAVHCIHTNSRELQILKSRNANVVHNPESNMGNAAGCCPAIRMIGMGINVGLGTDGYTHDMFESLKVANIIHKHHLCDSNVAWAEAPMMLNANNTKIARKYFSREAGVLKEGSFGDVIIVDYTPHTPMNENNIDSHAIFGMMGRQVTHTIVGGKMLMKDRELLVADEQAIWAKSRELATDLWKRIG